jgi:hypothetical protein
MMSPRPGKVQHARRTATVHQSQEGEQPRLRRLPGAQRKLPLLRKSIDFQDVGLVVEVAVALRQPQRQQEPTLQSGTSPSQAQAPGSWLLACHPPHCRIAHGRGWLCYLHPVLALTIADGFEHRSRLTCGLSSSRTP